MQITILEDGRKTAVDARVDGDRVLVTPDDLERALGWTLKPEGLCRGGICVPVAASSNLTDGGRIDLDALAGALGRPLAKDVPAGAVSIGDSADDRRAVMRGGMAPDFTLPDLRGRTHSLGDYRGRKALLIAWASW